MRAVLGLGLALCLSLCLSITLCASANAAAGHRTVHQRPRQPVIVPSPQGGTAPHFAVPGWSDDATRRWLDNASSGWTHA